MTLMTAAFAFAILRRGQHFGTNGFHKEKRTFRLRSSAKASRCTFSISQMIQAKMVCLAKYDPSAENQIEIDGRNKRHNYPAETGTRILSYPCDWCIWHYGNRLAPYKEEANCTFVGRAYRIISCCLYCQPLHSIRY